jgi:malonate transporter and related proteins
MALATRVFRVTGNAAVVAGFTAGQPNTVFVGVPMILKAYGDEGAVPLFLIAVHLPVVILAATLMVEGRSVAPATLMRRVLVNPFILAILVGSAARPVAGALPDPLWRMVEMLGAAAIPCALIAMGIALHRYGFEAGWPVPALITVLKLGLHPLIVFLLATRVFSMPPAWVGVAVLFAACPSGVNAYLFAERYGEGVAQASSAIALSTALCIVTTLLWLQVLSVG